MIVIVPSMFAIMSFAKNVYISLSHTLYNYSIIGIIMETGNHIRNVENMHNMFTNTNNRLRRKSLPLLSYLQSLKKMMWQQQ